MVNCPMVMVSGSSASDLNCPDQTSIFLVMVLGMCMWRVDWCWFVLLDRHKGAIERHKGASTDANLLRAARRRRMELFSTVKCRQNIIAVFLYLFGEYWFTLRSISELFSFATPWDFRNIFAFSGIFSYIYQMFKSTSLVEGRART